MRRRVRAWLSFRGGAAAELVRAGRDSDAPSSDSDRLRPPPCPRSALRPQMTTTTTGSPSPSTFALRRALRSAPCPLALPVAPASAGRRPRRPPRCRYRRSRARQTRCRRRGCYISHCESDGACAAFLRRADLDSCDARATMRSGERSRLSMRRAPGLARPYHARPAVVRGAHGRRRPCQLLPLARVSLGRLGLGRFGLLRGRVVVPPLRRLRGLALRLAGLGDRWPRAWSSWRARRDSSGAAAATARREPRAG